MKSCCKPDGFTSAGVVIQTVCGSTLVARLPVDEIRICLSGVQQGDSSSPWASSSAVLWISEATSSCNCHEPPLESTEPNDPFGLEDHISFATIFCFALSLHFVVWNIPVVPGNAALQSLGRSFAAPNVEFVPRWKLIQVALEIGVGAPWAIVWILNDIPLAIIFSEGSFASSKTQFVSLVGISKQSFVLPPTFQRTRLDFLMDEVLKR